MFWAGFVMMMAGLAFILSSSDTGNSLASGLGAGMLLFGLLIALWVGGDK